jgi:two-component system response regulator DctR
MKAPNLNLYIVDDDKDVRESLSALFIARRYRVQAFESGESFLSNAETGSCGCVLLDIDMDPGMSGLNVFDELRKQGSPLVVTLLSGVLNVPTAAAYMEKGVFYCLEKNCAESFLLQRVEQAMEFAQSLSEKLVHKMDALKLWETLTPRQRDVARVDRRGMLNKQTADELGIDVRTVETHKSHIYKKLGLRSATALDRLMRENDIE